MAGKHLTYQEMALQAAKELWYSQTVIGKIKAAKDDNEILKIMINARKGLIK